MHHLNKNTITTAVLAVTLMVGAAAAFLSTPQMAQALTLEEAIDLLNAGADVVEDFDQEGADRLRDAAAQLGDVPPCPTC